MLRRPRISTPFPYTTLFRSHQAGTLALLLEIPADELGPTLGDHLGIELIGWRSEEHTSELQSLTKLVFRLLLEKKNGEGHGQHDRDATNYKQDIHQRT